MSYNSLVSFINANKGACETWYGTRQNQRLAYSLCKVVFCPKRTKIQSALHIRGFSYRRSSQLQIKNAHKKKKSCKVPKKQNLNLPCVKPWAGSTRMQWCVGRAHGGLRANMHTGYVQMPRHFIWGTGAASGLGFQEGRCWDQSPADTQGQLCARTVRSLIVDK